MTATTNALEVYYHATMHKYEQQERIKNRQIKQVRSVSRKEKKKILRHSRERLSNWFSVEHFSQSKHPQSFKNYNEFTAYLSMYPLQDCFRFPIVTSEQFPCPLLDESIAWIHKGRDQHIRYYSKRKSDLSVAFDLIDFVEITEDVNTLEALALLAKRGNIQIHEKIGQGQLREKYEKNLTDYNMALSGGDELHEFLLPLHDVYSELQFVASSGIGEWVKNEHLFFASVRFLEQRIGDVTYTSIYRILNTLDAIGLIKRLEEKDVPKPLLVGSKSWANAMGYSHAVDYYEIPPFEEVEKLARERVRKIKGKGWSYRNFINPSKKEWLVSPTPAKNYTNDERLIYERFKRNLLMRGFVTKDIAIREAPCSKSKARIIVDENWKDWLKEMDCVYKRPTKEMKIKLNLKGFSYIAYRKQS